MQTCTSGHKSFYQVSWLTEDLSLSGTGGWSSSNQPDQGLQVVQLERKTPLSGTVGKENLWTFLLPTHIVSLVEVYRAGDRGEALVAIMAVRMQGRRHTEIRENSQSGKMGAGKRGPGGQEPRKDG